MNNREAIQTTQRTGRKRRQERQDTRSERAREIGKVSSEDEEVQPFSSVGAAVRFIGGRAIAGLCRGGATRRSRGGARAVFTKKTTRSSNKRVRFS
jgi:hypothetical protein